MIYFKFFVNSMPADENCLIMLRLMNKWYGKVPRFHKERHSNAPLLMKMKKRIDIANSFSNDNV